MTTDKKPRATAHAWRSSVDSSLNLHLYGAGLSATIGLTHEDALALGEELIKLATTGPRVGTAADLGCAAL